MKYTTKWMVVPYNSSCIKSQPNNILYDNNLPDDVKFKLYNQELLKKITKNTVNQEGKDLSATIQDEQRLKLTAKRPNKPKRKLDSENQVAEKLFKNSIETHLKSPVKKLNTKANKPDVTAAPKIDRTKNVINESVVEMELDEIDDFPKNKKANYLKNTSTALKEYSINPEVANLVNWEHYE